MEIHRPRDPPRILLRFLTSASGIPTPAAPGTSTLIHAPVFYQGFDAGFAVTAPLDRLSRVRGGPSRYAARTSAGPIRFWFRVNPKASAIPNEPGVFWPEVSDHADGLVSWYQYTGADQIASLQALQHRVFDKVASQSAFEHELYREMRDAGLPTLLHHVRSTPEPRFPHHALHYLDAEDAHAWGRLFGSQMSDWLAAYAAGPETLEAHMTRLHWTD